MSAIMYYSTKCRNCDKILSELTRTEVQKDIHFVCIDNRVKKNDHVYAVLESGEEVVLPREVSKVPALLLLRENNRILFGNDIYNILDIKVKEETSKATRGNMEPHDFAFTGNIHSTAYSSIDETADEGLEGCYASASYDNLEQIETPPEDYVPDKLNEESVKQYQEERNSVVMQR